MSPGSSPSEDPGQRNCPKPPKSWKPERPNVLITGTPGVGKSTVCAQVASELGLRHVDVGSFAREHDLCAEYDIAHDAYYLDEDGVLDALEPVMTTGGVILDHHSCDWFPERWVQIVVVLRARTDVLYDRLVARGYAKLKLDNNMDAEIMQVVADEAVSSYPKIKVLQLQNNDEREREENVTKIIAAFRAACRPETNNPNDVVH